MRDALKRLLKEIVPPVYGGTVMVSNYVLADGHEHFMSELRRRISLTLAKFITDSKVLDGADQSCFTMKPRESLQATECTARIHVLTPAELEKIIAQAFEAGRNDALDDRF